jgi:hypothetical protein
MPDSGKNKIPVSGKSKMPDSEEIQFEYKGEIKI